MTAEKDEMINEPGKGHDEGATDKERMAEVEKGSHISSASWKRG